MEGTKAEADAKIARRAKIVFIILDINLLGCGSGQVVWGGKREVSKLMVQKQTSARAEGGKTIFQFNLRELGLWIIETKVLNLGRNSYRWSGGM